jgi:hypothetical protein
MRRYNTKRKLAKAIDVDALAKLPYREIVTRLYNEMIIKSDAARLSLAETAAALRIEQKMLLRRIAEGTASTEDIKALPAASSNLRRVLEAGGILEAKFEEECEDF